jgi:hypothetical protein
MVIGNFNYFDAFDFYPNVFAIWVGGNRIFVRLKNQPVRLVKVASPLSLSVAYKFVEMT